MLRPNLQKALFKYKLIESGCSLKEAILLFKAGLLSFNPESNEDFETYEIVELRFLKSLYFDSGLADKIVKAMLGKLKKPYSYSLSQIYWDFGVKEWKVIPEDAEDYIEKNLKEIIVEKFDKFLEDTEAKVDNIVELERLKNRIDERISGLKDQLIFVEMKKPIKCHLWRKKNFKKDDLYIKNNFDVLHTFEDDNHLSRCLVKCKNCGQLYFYEFLEFIDWEKGNDPQYDTFIPVETKAEAEKIAEMSFFELSLFRPCLRKDWPSTQDEPNIYWVGKDK
jgi:hypothetical protein